MNDQPFLDKVDALEFYVGSAKHWAYFHKNAMGFDMVGYSGPETGVRDRVSYLMQQGEVKIKLTSFITQDSEIGNHFKVHGDGIKDISIRVEDVDESVAAIEKRGIVKPSKISKIETGNGKLRASVIRSYGDTVHTLTDYSDYNSELPPGYDYVESRGKSSGVKKIDHVVGNVEDSKMDYWVNYYVKGLDFKQLISFDDKDISTKYSALRSKVVHYNNRKIIFPINEPALGLKKSQIQEFLDYYNSPGAQHAALLTDDIIKTVSQMKERGVEFLPTPPSYYETLKDRVGSIDEDIEKLKKLDILVDRDEDGYLLQIFTKPMGDRPTFFYEIIQRKGGTSFGKGNFKALFESIEQEQAKRGNL